MGAGSCRQAHTQDAKATSKPSEKLAAAYRAPHGPRPPLGPPAPCRLRCTGDEGHLKPTAPVYHPGVAAVDRASRPRTDHGPDEGGAGPGCVRKPRCISRAGGAFVPGDGWPEPELAPDHDCGPIDVQDPQVLDRPLSTAHALERKHVDKPTPLRDLLAGERHRHVGLFRQDPGGFAPSVRGGWHSPRRGARQDTDRRALLSSPSASSAGCLVVRGSDRGPEPLRPQASHVTHPGFDQRRPPRVERTARERPPRLQMTQRLAAKLRAARGRSG